MRLVTLEKDARWVPGLALEGGVLDIRAAWPEGGEAAPDTMNRLIRGQEEYLPRIAELAESADPSDLLDVSPGPAVDRPGKILCVGLNYRAHAEEAGMEIPAHPVLFGKFGNAIAASEQAIDITGFSHVDYEAELGVVIGRRSRHVPADEALNQVFGYCNANDLSDRELQGRSGQWLLGKTPDGFLPVGPWLVTADEVPDPQDLSIRGWLNGELRQSNRTSDMIFSIAEVIAYASSYFTLEPGDLIITGTPPGVIMGMNPRLWMSDGDEYTVEIEGLGRLSNRVVCETRAKR